MAFASLAWLVPLKSAGSARWILLAGVVVVTVAAWVLIGVFVRRLPRFPPTATVAILAGYVAMPFAVPLLQLAGAVRHRETAWWAEIAAALFVAPRR